MTTLEKQKVLLTLDGYTDFYEAGDNVAAFSKTGNRTGTMYLTSRDAIIPLVVSWCDKNPDGWKRFANEMKWAGLYTSHFALEKILKSDATQLCDALIRAAGMWKD